jgi:GT2 family glycosyltransferase
MRNPRSIVLLGMMTKMPVPGVVWQTVQYLVGFERLGYDVYYVEAHARTPSMFMTSEEDDGSGKAAAFIDGVMRRFGFRGRWAFQALHDNRSCYGMSEQELQRRYGEAEVLINLHGGTEPLPEHAATGRLIYVETDPVLAQAELYWGVQATNDFLEQHMAFFTFGENYGAPDCRLPISDRFDFKPTRQPVVLDFWRPSNRPHERFTTISSWRQDWREVTLDGETYSWSKHLEFMKFVDLPARTEQRFELALSGHTAGDERFLKGKGWRVREALETCGELDSYHKYIRRSRAEFTVAKDQNVRLRTGWFSDRSATYLAASRPVVTQDTGFGNALPTGDGLFAYSSLPEAVEAVERIGVDYRRQTDAARETAREYFDASVVLSRMLEEIGVGRAAAANEHAMPLTPRSRRPLELPDETVEAARALRVRAAPPQASIVVVTYGASVPTRLCLDSVLANTDDLTYELIVVDNGSDGAGLVYLRALAQANAHVRLAMNGENVGFAAALNQGLRMARGEILVVMNNDVIVPPRWLRRLARHLRDSSVGLAGPVTNRSGNEAEVRTVYETYGQFLGAAHATGEEHRGETTEIPTLTMFCVALRRDAYERIGPVDERFGRGLLEDDDYSRRARDAGYRLVCAEDVLVHHFGEASFGALVPTGEYDELLAENKRRFEQKWGEPWEPYERRDDFVYEALIDRVRETVQEVVPAGATVAIANRGDERLLELDGRRGWHFPQAEDGGYAGHHPGDGVEAIREVEEVRSRGADFLVFPRTAFWWLDHYADLRAYMEGRFSVVANGASCAVYALNAVAASGPVEESSGFVTRPAVKRRGLFGALRRNRR